MGNSNEATSASTPVTSTGPAPSTAVTSSGPARIVERLKLIELMDSRAVKLYDVREPHEVAATGALKHGPTTAVNVPLGRVQGGAFDLSDADFKREFNADRPSRDDLVVFSCRSGARSERACQHAININKFTNVFNYKGSANEWFAPR